MTRRVLLTGAGGFIGAHVLEHLLVNTDWDIVATDSFRHKGKTDRIREVIGDNESWSNRVKILVHDLTAPFSPQTDHFVGAVDYVLALASESHVDRSISDPVPFVRNNVDVVMNTLEFCRKRADRSLLSTHNFAAMPAVKHMILVSTDEVYGPVSSYDVVGHKEWAPILPSNPYSASKAAQEAIAFSYWRTYGVPVSIVNCMNLVGERQDREKYLPSLIAGISKGETVTIHGSMSEIGTRHYLHARNLADALLYLVQLAPHQYPHWTRPLRRNIVGPDRINNLDLAQMVANIIGKPLHRELVDFHSTRPGHDAHYGLDGSAMAMDGWKAPVSFTKSLARTVNWTLKHPEWML
jgi:dTDP-glucose 4,6-dehydratase